MKKLIALFCLTTVMNANGQLLKTDPNFILESSNNVLITADANKGNKNLQNFTGDVYVHIGVITNLSANSSAWKYVPTTIGVLVVLVLLALAQAQSKNAEVKIAK